MFWTYLLLALFILCVSFAGIGIKMFVKKDGRFERHCENKDDGHCVCGGKGGEACQRCPNRDNH